MKNAKAAKWSLIWLVGILSPTISSALTLILEQTWSYLEICGPSSWSKWRERTGGQGGTCAQPACYSFWILNRVVGTADAFQTCLCFGWKHASQGGIAQVLCLSIGRAMSSWKPKYMRSVAKMDGYSQILLSLIEDWMIEGPSQIKIQMMRNLALLDTRTQLAKAQPSTVLVCL